MEEKGNQCKGSFFQQDALLEATTSCAPKELTSDGVRKYCHHLFFLNIKKGQASARLLRMSLRETKEEKLQ